MENYKRIVSEIITNTPIQKEDIFDYENSPLEDEFDTVFEFYYEALKLNADYGIEPCSLFFTNHFSINAAATYVNGYYIICINKGTVLSLINRFRKKSDLLADCNTDTYIEFEKLLDVPINELMYQTAIHFTFYHEMAHLIQKSDLLEKTIYEYSENKSIFLIKNHILELDADKFSSLCLGAHSLQYVKKLFGNGLTNEQLEKTLIVICSSALFYILGFGSNKLGIYYKEDSHPHPIIRISCIVFHIVDYVIQALKEDGYNINLDIKDVLNKSIVFSNNLSVKKFNENLIVDYVDIASSEALNIAEYIKEMRELETNDKTLASYKWNERAKRLNNK